MGPSNSYSMVTLHAGAWWSDLVLHHRSIVSEEVVAQCRIGPIRYAVKNMSEELDERNHRVTGAGDGNQDVDEEQDGKELTGTSHCAS
jgi:hypothetical protein